MSWAKLDDAILDNPKIAKAGILGFALHVAAITWCARNLTDGFIPRQRVTSLLDVAGTVTGYLQVTPASREPCEGDLLRMSQTVRTPTADSIAAHMMECGLWRYDEERDGYWLKDYLEYNPSREKVLAERARKSANKVASRGKSRAVITEVTEEEHGDHGGSRRAVTTEVTGDFRARHHGPVPDPVPDQILPEAADPRPDRSSRVQTLAAPAPAPVPSRENVAKRPEKVPCPPDLDVPDTVKKQLDVQMVPVPARESIRRRFVAKAACDPSDLRTVVDWQKGLARALTSDGLEESRRLARAIERESSFAAPPGLGEHEARKLEEKRSKAYGFLDELGAIGGRK